MRIAGDVPLNTKATNPVFSHTGPDNRLHPGVGRRFASCRRRSWRRGASGLACCLAVVATGCGRPRTDGEAVAAKPGGGARRLIIFHAASLARPFAELEKRFEQQHPGMDVIRESSGSRMAIRKVTELHRDADLVASADEALLRELAVPDCATWVAVFARNRVVIAYTERSRYRSEIDADTWYDILLRPDVNFGYCNPNMAPVGYRTRLVWQLADRHYADRLGGRRISEELRQRCPVKFVRPHCNELIPLLESLSLDYTFQYRSVALQHNLEWLRLPDEIDLGNEALAETYASARVTVAGRTRAEAIERIGRPILYGISPVVDSPNPEGALDFLGLLFSPEGAAVLESNFQEPVAPPLSAEIAAVPERLRGLVKEMSQ